MNTPLDLSDRLREARLRLDLTQAGMAEKLGLPTVTYRSYESGRSEPPVSIFARLMNAGADAHYVVLGAPITELLPEHVDWELLAEVAQLISDWSDARPRPLDLDERSRYLQLGYNLAAHHGRATAVATIRALAHAA